VDFDEDEDVDSAQADAECTRKEYRRLTAAEVKNFQSTLNKMKSNGQYKIFVQYHRDTESPGAHFGPAFFPWHRCFLIMYDLFIYFNLSTSTYIAFTVHV